MPSEPTVKEVLDLIDKLCRLEGEGAKVVCLRMFLEKRTAQAVEAAKKKQFYDIAGDLNDIAQRVNSWKGYSQESLEYLKRKESELSKEKE